MEAEYLLRGTTDGHLYVVASSRVPLEVLHHVQKVDRPGRLGGQRQAASISCERGPPQSQQPHRRGEVVAPREDSEREHNAAVGHAETEAESQQGGRTSHDEVWSRWSRRCTKSCSSRATLTLSV